MHEEQSFNSVQNASIRLEIVSNELELPDIAELDEVSQEIVDELRHNGYTVNPAPTGERGGSVYDIVLQMAHFIHDNKETLLAALDVAAPVLKYLLSVRDNRAKREREHHTPLELTLYIDGKSMDIKVPDAESGAKLLENFQRTTLEGLNELAPVKEVKIRVKVPKKRRRRPH